MRRSKEIPSSGNVSLWWLKNWTCMNSVCLQCRSSWWIKSETVSCGVNFLDIIKSPSCSQSNKQRLVGRFDVYCKIWNCYFCNDLISWRYSITAVCLAKNKFLHQLQRNTHMFWHRLVECSPNDPQNQSMPLWKPNISRLPSGPHCRPSEEEFCGDYIGISRKYGSPFIIIASFGVCSLFKTLLHGI